MMPSKIGCAKSIVFTPFYINYSMKKGLAARATSPF